MNRRPASLASSHATQKTAAHEGAAFHHETAAYHHREAARHTSEGDFARAERHTNEAEAHRRSAHDQGEQARRHTLDWDAEQHDALVRSRTEYGGENDDGMSTGSYGGPRMHSGSESRGEAHGDGDPNFPAERPRASGALAVSPQSSQPLPSAMPLNVPSR